MKLPARAAQEKKQTIKAPRRRPRLKGGQVAAIGAVVVLAGLVAMRKRNAASAPHAEVKTALVSRGDVRATVSATGKLQAFSAVDVKSKAGGTVLKMAVEEGTRVKAGQLICLIDRQDTTAAFRQASADVASAQAAVRQAQQNARLQSATLGPQIEQSAEGISAAQARLNQARQNFDLQRETTGPQIAQSVEAVSAARARLNSANQSLILQRRTSEAAIAEAHSGVAASRARLAQAEATARSQPALSRAGVEQAQAGVDAANANLQSSQESLTLLQSATQPQAAASAQAQVEQAQSEVETAQTSLNRLQGLFDKGFVARTQVDAAQNALVGAKSGLRTAQARFDTLKAEQASQISDAQARIEQARGSLNQARASLSAARTNGVQVELRTGDVTAARAALRQAQSGLNTAIANRRQIALKQSDVEVANAALRQSQAALQSTRAGTRNIDVKAADVQSAQAAVRQAQAALRGTQANALQSNVRAEDVAGAQARLARAQITAQNARTNLEQTRVVAPRDGVVLKKYVDVGTIIQSGQSGAAGGTAIIQLANVARIFVDVQVDEADIALIESGQKVDIALDAYPSSPKSGTVRKVFPEAETLTNVTYVHVQVEVDEMDVDERLRPNLNATCDFLVEEKQGVLTVPGEAVKDDGDTAVVTKIKNPKAPLWEETNQEKKTVEVGVRGDENAEIVSGLKEGDTVVTQVIEPVTAAPAAASGGLGAGGGSRGAGGGGRGFR